MLRAVCPLPALAGLTEIPPEGVDRATIPSAAFSMEAFSRRTDMVWLPRKENSEKIERMGQRCGYWQKNVWEGGGVAFLAVNTISNADYEA